MGARVQRLPAASGIELCIFAKKEWSSLIFLPLWLTFWTFGGLTAMKWLIQPGPSTPRAFIFLWLIAWALGEAWAVYQWFWTAFGREVVSIREGTLTIRRAILSYGRDRVFDTGSITNLRASGIFPTNSSWDNYLMQMKLAGGTVGFDCQGKT
jgi:hypothetical protein